MFTLHEKSNTWKQPSKVLECPERYIGSMKERKRFLWVYDEKSNTMINRMISYVPGLYNIFDEILVKVANNVQEGYRMDTVKVVIDREENWICLYNVGNRVPVEIHQRVYVPEVKFGRSMAAVFSTKFVIETADGVRRKKYKQVFEENMKKNECNISEYWEGDNWTKVSFKPDLKLFHKTRLEDDDVALMKKRVVDLAGCLGMSVEFELNGSRVIVPVKSFEQYVDLYPQSDCNIFYERNLGLEICVTLSEGRQFQQVSFVNGIATVNGGPHVDFVIDQIVKYVMAAWNAQNENAEVEARDVLQYLSVFVNAFIENPCFDKENLKLGRTNLGGNFHLGEEFLENVAANSGIMENLDICAISGLKDAYFAGGRNSNQCTLILAIGDSAGFHAMQGQYYMHGGRDLFGVFQLEGKLFKDCETSRIEVLNNDELSKIEMILGVEQFIAHDNIKSLRYGQLMIVTEQDLEGSLFKCLLIGLIYRLWPSLLKIRGFLGEFIMPIVKATDEKELLYFYSMPEYNAWKEREGANTRDWSIKFYKAWGSMSAEECCEYFRDIESHRKYFVLEDDQDKEAIELAFSNRKIDARRQWLQQFERKKWLLQFEPDTHLQQKKENIKYHDFINKELRLSFMVDLQSSIPSMVDGLKPGQRKILYYAFEKNLIKTKKVFDFSSDVIGYPAYPAYFRCGQNVTSSIISMAQDFVGSNNINLLQADGSFGTRFRGGKDVAGAEFKYTALSPITRFLFPKDDDMLLDYLSEDGRAIGPKWYLPIIPMVLVNGIEGFGTVWSSYVPNYNPREIVANVRRLLNNEELEPMHPWYRGFKGTIEQAASNEPGVTYTVRGSIEIVDDKTLRIKEPPIRRCSLDYLEFLIALAHQADLRIEGLSVYRDGETEGFDVFLSKQNMALARRIGVEALLYKFKLITSISTSNMHLFDSKGFIKKYETPGEILTEFFHLRSEFYKKRMVARKEYLKSELLKSRDREKLEELNDLAKATVKSLWEKDLDALEKQLDEFEKAAALAKDKRQKFRDKVRRAIDLAFDEFGSESVHQR